MDLSSLFGGTDTGGIGVEGTGGWSSLLQNKLFLSLLAGAGTDIGAGKPLGTNVNAVMNQAIRAQNYSKLLKRLLGPDESKATFSNKGINLSIPQTSLSDMGGGAFLGEDPLGLKANTPTPTPTVDQSKLGTINPFAGSQPWISASDLAGLTPQDISSALGGAMGVESLKQKKISDAIDMIYKGEQMKHLAAQTKKLGEPEPLDQPFPISVPGIGKVTSRQWSSLPDDERRYALFVNSAKQLGDQDIMSKEEFETWVAEMKPSDRTKFLKDLIKDPKLMQAEKSLRASSAIRISLGEKLTEKKALSELSGQLYFNDPQWTTELDKHLSSKDVQDKLFSVNVPANPKATKEENAAAYKEAMSKARSTEIARFIDSKIVGGGGTIQKVKWASDGKTMIWTIKWPSGDVKEVRYAVE